MSIKLVRTYFFSNSLSFSLSLSLSLSRSIDRSIEHVQNVFIMDVSYLFRIACIQLIKLLPTHYISWKLNMHKTKRHHSVKTERRHSVTIQSPFSRLNGRHISVTIQWPLNVIEKSLKTDDLVHKLHAFERKFMIERSSLI